MRKKLLCIPLLAALLVCTLCFGAAADEVEIDMSYIGPLDTFTGNPVSSSGGTADGTSTWISDRVQYEKRGGMYVYPVGDSLHNKLRATVMDGMIVDESVVLKPDEGVQISLFRNGEYQSAPVWDNISAPGEYVVTAGTGSQSGDRLLSFSIIAKQNNTVKSYRMPEGFLLMEATRNGEDIYFDRNYVDLSEEGAYYIKYRCARTDIVYELQYTADFTAPVLALEAVTDGVARGPVDVSDLEPGAAMGVWLNGEPVGHMGELTRSGDYTVKVADEAGNMSTYTFTIQLYFDGNSIVFFAIIVAVIIATVIYVITSRKRLRVR